MTQFYFGILKIKKYFKNNITECERLKAWQGEPGLILVFVELGETMPKMSARKERHKRRHDDHRYLGYQGHSDHGNGRDEGCHRERGNEERPEERPAVPQRIGLARAILLQA